MYIRKFQMARLARPENKSSCHIFFCVLWARLALAATIHKAQARPLREGWGAGVLEQHTGWTERGPETRRSQPEGTCGEKRPQPQHGGRQRHCWLFLSGRRCGVSVGWRAAQRTRRRDRSGPEQRATGPGNHGEPSRVLTGQSQMPEHLFSTHHSKFSSLSLYLT